MTLRYAGTLARTPRPSAPHWRRVPRPTASPANERGARGGAGRHRAAFPAVPSPPSEAGPGLGGGRARLINQGLVVDAGGGDATQGGKPAMEKEGAGFVLPPRVLLTGPKLPPRWAVGERGREVGAGAGRRSDPSSRGGRTAQGGARCGWQARGPACLRASLPGSSGSMAARCPFPAASRARGAPEPAPPSAGVRPRPRPWALSGASSEPFTCQVPGKWKSPVLDVIGERRRACWRRKMRFP